VESAAGALGGVHYTYALRGDGTTPVRRASAAEQQAAMRSLLATIAPAALALPQGILDRIPPRPPGFGRDRETFPRYTGATFDAITPAVVATDHVISSMLGAGDRAARLVQQKAIDPTLPGLEDVIDAVFAATFGATPRTPYEAEIKRAVERLVIDQLIDLAGSAQMPQVRAIANLKLQQRMADLGRPSAARGDGDVAHAALLAADIKRFMDRPAMAVAVTTAAPAIPPGAPIGDPAMSWIRRVEPWCSFQY
jgi:hypothetical protein